MRRHIRLCSAVAVACAATLIASSHAAAQSTSFTDATGNHLWSDPANWSAGLPGVSKGALLTQSYGTLTVDLGGAEQTAASVRIAPTLESAITLRNGTLRTAAISSIYNFGGEVSGVDLLPLGGRMTIAGVQFDGDVGRPITDDAFDLFVSAPFFAETRLFGDLYHRGRTVIGRQADPSNYVPAHVLLAGQLHASRDIDITHADVATFQPTWKADTRVHLTAATWRPLSATPIDQLRISGAASIAETDTVVSPTARSVDAARLIVDADAVLTFYTGVSSTGIYNVRAVDAPVAFTNAGGGPRVAPFARAANGNLVVYDLGSDGLKSGDDVGFRPLRALEQVATLTNDAHVALTTTTTNIVAANASATPRTVALATSARLRVDGILRPSDGAVALDDSAIVDGAGTLDVGTSLYVHGTRNNASGAERRPTIAVSLIGDGRFVSSRGVILSGQNRHAGGTVVHTSLGLAATGALGNGGLRLVGPTSSVDVSVANFAFPRVIDVGASDGTPAFTAFVTSNAAGMTVHDVAGGASRLSIGSSNTSRAAPVVVDGSISADIGNVDIIAPDIVFDGHYGGATNLLNFSGSAPHTLSGTGRVDGRLWFYFYDTAGASAISPGPGRFDAYGIGSMYAGELTLGRRLRIDLSVSASDAFVVERALEAFSFLDIHLVGGATPAMGTVYTIIDLLDPAAPRSRSDFRSLPEGSTLFGDDAATRFRVSYVGGDGNDVTLTVVPEPAAATVISAALAGAVARRRRSAISS